jgi:type IV secretory pathway VirB2 component (pilin)
MSKKLKKAFDIFSPFLVATLIFLGDKIAAAADLDSILQGPINSITDLVTGPIATLCIILGLVIVGVNILREKPAFGFLTTLFFGAGLLMKATTIANAIRSTWGN